MISETVRFKDMSKANQIFHNLSWIVVGEEDALRGCWNYSIILRMLVRLGNRIGCALKASGRII